MSENFRFSEHQRINQYLRIRTMKAKSKIITRNSNQLSNFPIGLIIITNDGLSFDYKIEFINLYACRLFKVKEDIDISVLKQKFSEYIKLKNNYTTKSYQSLNDIIFNTTSYNLEMDNFIPFENSHSKTSILYIKINDIDNDKYIVIDKYDRYIDEKRYIEFNLIKTINYQYLHTLYHELNNPLNALLALSGETNKFDQTEINGSKIYEKLTILQKNSLKKRRKKDKKGGGTFLSLNNGKNKFGSKDMTDDYKVRRRSVGDLNFGLNNKIPLLVNIIKVFIKNFILYLKIRADSLLQLKNEFEQQNEVSDLMNAVEVSEYEKELTKNKCVKINLEYILELYLQKYLCLFQYKEIEYDTFFEKLSNMYVVTDEFNFSYYIRQIYTYLYYVVPKKEGFYFEYSEENNTLKIMIKKKSGVNLSRTTEIYKITKEEGNIFKMEQAIQTKEMTKEVLYAMSKKLKFDIEIFDCENLEQNNYLYITIPIEKNERSEFEDFKDEEINEMVDKDAIILEEKLRRQLPENIMNNDSFLDKKVSNISSQFMDILSKSGEELKWSNDSFSSIHKIHMQNNNLKNACVNLPNNSEKNIIFTESQNKVSSIKKNNSSNSLLSKCLKFSESRKVEKSKFKNTAILEKDKISSKNKDGNNNNNNLRSISSLKSLNVSIKGKNDKSKNSEQKSKNSLSQKSNGIFTLINKNGKTKKIDMIDNNLSELQDLAKNKKDEVTVTFKEQSGFYSGYASSIKAKIISENKSIHNKLNNDKICSGTQNSTSLISGLVGRRNPSKVKSSLFVSEINGGDKDDKSKYLEKNGYILIELEKDKNNLMKKMNKNITNKLFLHPIEEENEKKMQSSQKTLLSDKNNKNNLSENAQNEKHNKTLVDNNIDENESLFFKAIKESKVHMEKTNKKNKLLNFSQSSDQKSPPKKHNSDGESINDSDYFFHSEEECNCADLLVVDDEEFNVIASQRILQNLGFESDAAYNGEECINLINRKLNSKCKCNRLCYKIIFLDIVMPIMDGIKTANEIQNMIDKKILNDETKIVFISGNINDSKLKNSLLEINCVKECLQKPVNISKYKMIIEKYYN